MFRVALTGGIGCGKTTVANHLAELGAGVVDTDVIAHELTAVGSPLLDEIVAAFGRGIRASDGALDRARMRSIVFADTAARKRLESILHPAIRRLMSMRAAALNTPYVVLVIPLLFETGQEVEADRVLVVDVPERLQIERVRCRNGLAEAEIQRIMASQVSRAERLARADDILDNSGDFMTLQPRIEQLHAHYLQLAADSCSTFAS